MEDSHTIYHVALKAVLQKDGLVLVLRDAKTNRLDFPGGRINASEHNIPLLDILNREVREELGLDANYALGAPIFQFKRNNHLTSIPIFITAYEAEYISGDIILSSENSAFEWVNPKNTVLQLEDFGNEEELHAIQTYFNSLK